MTVIGALWLFIGTGDRYHPNNTRQSVLRHQGRHDNDQWEYIDRIQFNQSKRGTGSVTQGWYVPMVSNEKVLASADVFNSVFLYQFHA